MHPFWDSREGRRIQFQSRALTTFQAMLNMEPKSKRSAKARDRAHLRNSIETDGHWWWKARSGTVAVWPRPRAALALDIHVFPARRDPPRIDTVCKWLLDELGSPETGPLIYRDDRQVKWLFAVLHPPQSRAAASAFFGDDALGIPAESDVQPKIYIAAQTRANRIADLNLATMLDPAWAPGKRGSRMYDEDFPTNPFLRDEFHIDFETEYLRDLAPESSEFERTEHARVTASLEYQRHARNLDSLDRLIPAALKRAAGIRSGMDDQVFSLLRNHPYAFEFGTTPQATGDSVAFRARVRQMFEDRKTQRPDLFPLKAQIGVTALYVEAGQGKDLDNLVRSVLPALLDTFQPPHQDQPYFDPEVTKASPVGIRFLEAISFPDEPPGLKPGTVLLLLTNGWRHRSWWEDASDFVDREDERSRWE